MTQSIDIESLRRELHEAYDTLRAIHEGEVDAFVTKRRGDYRVEALVGADTPYRVFVESMRDGAVTVSADGTILYCNRPFSTAVGLDAAQVVGVSVVNWVKTDVELSTLLEQALHGESRAEATLDSVAGSTPVAVTACALTGDEEKVFCLILHDLTDRLTAQELRVQQALLSRQRAELEAICRQLPFALLLAESADAFSYVNPAAESLLASYPELRVLACAAAAKALDTATPTAPEETSLASRNASAAAFRVQAIPLNIEAAMPRALIVIQDVTVERRAQRARERQDHFREVFVGILGHDLRTPLTAITSGVQVLRIGPDRDKVMRAASAIERAAGRMQKLIDDMLDLTLSRIGGGIPLTRRTTNLQDVVGAAVQELEATSPHTKFEFFVQGDTIGQWDAARLTQVASNLLSNAVEYGAEGLPIRVEIDGTADASVTLAVTNQGKPIAAELLPSIFDPFRQGNVAERRGRGIGLGLYIAERIAAAHGGMITVRSNATEGTTFSVVLPRSPSLKMRSSRDTQP